LSKGWKEVRKIGKRRKTELGGLIMVAIKTKQEKRNFEDGKEKGRIERTTKHEREGNTVLIIKEMSIQRNFRVLMNRFLMNLISMTIFFSYNIDERKEEVSKS
jgi:hypothetical protein